MANSRKYPKWTKARRDKFTSTVKAKKKHFRAGRATVDLHPAGVKICKGSNQKDAIVFLRHARANIVDRMQRGSLKSPDQAHLYMLLALAILSGDAL